MNRPFFAGAAFLILLRAGTAEMTNPPPSQPNATASSTVVSEQRQSLLDELKVAVSPSVFPGDTFPQVDCVQPELVRQALGAYTIDTRYFDAGWNEVKKPTAPGRYGALIVIHFSDGTSLTRHVTLYHAADFSRARESYRARMVFPPSLGLPADMGETESWNIDEQLDNGFESARYDGGDVAPFLAALHDIAADPARYRGYECHRVDYMWWDELEKRLGLARPYEKLVRTPDGYDADPKKKWPLILFLHGSGERGSDLSILKKAGPAAYADGSHPLPFIVVTPLCPAEHWWNPELLVELVDGIEKNYRVDSSRLYVTGLSMGGIGSLDLAAAYPGRFAALASLSGRENPGIAARLRGQPVWLFHGAEDEVVPARHSVELAAALRAEGSPCKLTLIPHTGHGGWGKVYADPALYAWFLRYRN